MCKLFMTKIIKLYRKCPNKWKDRYMFIDRKIHKRTVIPNWSQLQGNSNQYGNICSVFVEANDLNLKLYKKHKSKIVLGKQGERNSPYENQNSLPREIEQESHWCNGHRPMDNAKSSERHS